MPLSIHTPSSPTDTALSHRVQVKICGLTRPEEAAACTELGADAIGLIFYPPSPRHVDDRSAAAISAGLPPVVARIGVFVDVDVEQILIKAHRCGLTGVQLHGAEPPAAVKRLRQEGLIVLKALFAGRHPGLEKAADYSPTGFLVECGRGRLPGGNAETWNWAEARRVSSCGPLILAGGLSPENVADAIGAARPDAVDVSSGVERAPGRKDLDRVAALIRAVRKIDSGLVRRVFG